MIATIINVLREALRRVILPITLPRLFVALGRIPQDGTSGEDTP